LAAQFVWSIVLKNKKMIKIFDTIELLDEKSITSIHYCKNVELISPFYYYESLFLQLDIDKFCDILEMNNLVENFYQKLDENERERLLNDVKIESQKSFYRFVKKIYDTKLPEVAFKIFEITEEKYIKKILKGMEFSSDILKLFYFEAFNRFNYLFSHYNFKKYDKSFSSEELQFGAIIEKDGSVSRFGDTNLTDKQIKHIINNRKIYRADFVEKGDKWHCFFWTSKAIMGKENSKVFENHIHYINYTWGISKEYVLEQLASDWYSLKGIHLKFSNENNNNRNT
jgi:hypothetical protein